MLLAVMPLAGMAQEKAAPEVFTDKVGVYEVVLLLENQGQGNTSILIGATPEMISQTIPNGNYPNAVNAFLVKTPKGNILIDTGFGRNLKKNLAEAGITPEQINTLIITHAHGDHIGGMLTAEGQRAFPNAQLVMSNTEKDYWVDTKQQESMIRAYDAYKNNVQLIQPVEPENATGDGIFHIDAPGHTPGHIAVLLRSKGEQMLICGDLTHAMAIQIPYPQVSVTYDTDPALAAKTRKHILKFVSDRNIPIAGMHIAYPGMGNVEEIGTESYSFTPMSLPSGR